MRERKILFYCQHLLGVGHLTRSLAVAQACLNDGWSVDFAQGGPDIGRTLNHEAFRLIPLAPLLMNAGTGELYNPSDARPLSEVFAERSRQLAACIDENDYDCVITELFPFGRGKFKAEVVTTLQRVRTRNPRALRACSVRDILVKKESRDDWEQKVIRLVEDHYDVILVHGDERVVRFDETFPSADRLKNHLFYTGYVSESGKRAASGRTRANEILVSLGGGAVGEELARAVLEITGLFPDHIFRFVTGPYSSTDLKREVLERAKGSINIRLEEFLSDFEDELARVQLSISMGGYNTLMNILATATPALVLPHDRDWEQALRAERLEALDQIKVLQRPDLAPNRLAPLIADRLGRRPRKIDLNLEGGRESARHLAGMLERAFS